MTRKLYGGLTTPPPLSAYASAAAKTANAAFVEPSRFAIAQRQHDVLALEESQLADVIAGRAPAVTAATAAAPTLVTLLFTLNELFTAAGVGRTTTLLLRLGSVVPKGSLLLVVDSPGSYSETLVGGQARRYPMQWLLHRVLTSADDCVWEKVASADSAWFRLADELDYPIPLEDMRYQMHLYRAAEPSTSAV